MAVAPMAGHWPLLLVRERVILLRLPRLVLPRMPAIALLWVPRWLAVILWVRQCVFPFPKHPKGTNCLQMADVLRTLMVYRRDAVDARALPLRYGNPF